MMPKEILLFLDIDGVLNTANTWLNPGPKILWENMKQLNRLLESTKVNIIISSSWRYQVLLGACTLKGFKYMLESHGIHHGINLVGTTRFEDKEKPDRTHEIKSLIHRSKILKSNDALIIAINLNAPIIVIDDLDLSFPKENNIFFLKTDPNLGLTEEDVDKILSHLRFTEASRTSFKEYDEALRKMGKE